MPCASSGPLQQVTFGPRQNRMKFVRICSVCMFIRLGIREGETLGGTNLIMLLISFLSQDSYIYILAEVMNGLVVDRTDVVEERLSEVENAVSFEPSRDRSK